MAHRLRRSVRYRRAPGLAAGRATQPHNAHQAHQAHQALHGATGHRDVLPVQLPPHLPGAVDLEVFIPHPPDLGRQRTVTTHTRRQPPRVGRPRFMLVVCRRGDRQLGADRLDPVSVPVSVDKRHRHLGLRSDSAWAKKAEALRRISLARFNSRFSRSSVLSRSRSEVVRPSRNPWSRSV